jgi:hypothetical protein
MAATLDQIQVITSHVGVDCTVSINKDYTYGEVCDRHREILTLIQISPAKILPVLRWNAESAIEIALRRRIEDLQVNERGINGNQWDLF